MRHKFYSTAFVITIILMITLFLSLGTVTAQESTPTPVAQEATQLDLDTLLDDIDEYQGVQVRVTGDLSDAVAPQAFRLQDDDPVFQESILVIYDTTLISDANVDLLAEEDLAVQVTGIVTRFDYDDVVAETGFDLDIDLFEEFESESILIASNVELVEALDPEKYATIGDVLNDSELYMGQQVSLRGELSEALNPYGFTLSDDGSILVIYNTDQVSNLSFIELIEQGIDARVNGTVQPFDIATVEDLHRTRFNIDVFAPFEGELMLIADHVTLLDTPEDVAYQSTSQIIEHPDFFTRDFVVTRGIVNDALTTNFFVLEDIDDGGSTILVAFDDERLADVNIAELSDEEVAVEIRGRVQEFDRVRYEGLLETELDVDTFDPYEEQVVIVAQSIRLIDELPDDLNNIDAILDEPELYYGQPVMVEGELEQAFNVNSFKLDGGDEIIVIYDTEQIADVNVVELAEQDIQVRVSGTVVDFTRDNIDVELEIDLFDRFEGQPAIIAERVEVIEAIDADDFQSIDEIEGNVALYQGQTVILEEDLVEVITTDAFLLQHEEFLDFDQILVLFRSEDFPELDLILLADEDATVRVTGTVEPFAAIELGERLNINLEDPVFEDFEDSAVIVAEEILVIDRD